MRIKFQNVLKRTNIWISYNKPQNFELFDLKTQREEIKYSFLDLSRFITNGFKTISYPFGYRSTYNNNTFKVMEERG